MLRGKTSNWNIPPTFQKKRTQVNFQLDLCLVASMCRVESAINSLMKPLWEEEKIKIETPRGWLEETCKKQDSCFRPFPLFETMTIKNWRTLVGRSVQMNGATKWKMRRWFSSGGFFSRAQDIGDMVLKERTVAFAIAKQASVEIDFTSTSFLIMFFTRFTERTCKNANAKREIEYRAQCWCVFRTYQALAGLDLFIFLHFCLLIFNFSGTVSIQIRVANTISTITCYSQKL